MKLIDCLNCLNLKNGFTIDQLNKAMRDISRKMHPDVLRSKGASEEEIQEADKRFQELSDIYNRLLKFRQNRNVVSLEEYKSLKCNQIKERLNVGESFVNFNDILLSEYGFDISIYDFDKLYELIQSAKNKEEVNRYYKNVCSVINDLFDLIRDNYFGKFFIGKEAIDESIDYSNFGLFLLSLKSIKEKYSKLLEFREMVVKELKRYKNKKYFNDLENLIENEIDLCINLGKVNEFMDMRLLISLFRYNLDMLFINHGVFLRDYKDLEEKICVYVSEGVFNNSIFELPEYEELINIKHEYYMSGYESVSSKLKDLDLRVEMRKWFISMGVFENGHSEMIVCNYTIS